MKVLAYLKTSAAWLLLPALLVLGGVAWAVSQYEPLVFDASLYETADEGAAVELETVDAAALEAAGAGGTASASAAAAAAVDTLADGTWVGYAACGKGNDDGWKPYYVAVAVTVEDGAVKRIEKVYGTSTGDSGAAALAWDAAENQAYLDWASGGRTVGGTSYTGVATQLKAAIAKGTATPGSIDVVSGATYSSEAIFEAYYAALSKAAAAAGSSLGASASTSTSAAASAAASTASTVKASVDTSTLGMLADGSYTGHAACGVGNEDDWQPYYVAVTIAVKGGVVAGIESIEGTSTGNDGDEALSWDADENQAYLTYAIDGRTRKGTYYEGVRAQLAAYIAAGEYPSSIDVVSGATYSSEAIFEAYYDALQQAAEAAGSTVEVPDDAADAGTGSAEEDATEGATDDAEEGGYTVATDLVDGAYYGAALCEDEDNPGEYSPYYVIVKIAVEGGVVTEVTSIYGDAAGVVDPDCLYDASENGSYLSRASSGTLKKTGVKKQIQNLIDAGGAGYVSEDTVDVISNATWSSYAIIHAYEAAYEQALEAAERAADGEDTGEDYGTTDNIKVYKEDDDDSALSTAAKEEDDGGDE